ncbi:MAG TPA: hypothetical protein VGD79_09205 [Thermoanaerobaculia bacterium]
MQTRTFRLLLAAGLAAYFVLLLRNSTFVVGGADSAGYFSEAKLIASGRLALAVEPMQRMQLDSSWTDAFPPGGFRPRGRELVPTYPIGLPVHIAAVASVGGWEVAPFLLMPLAAVGCLMLMIAIGRELELPRWAQVVAAAALAAFPPFLVNAIQPMSDVVSLFWCLLAVWLSVRGSRAAGVAFAIAVLVRSTNLLLGLVMMRRRPGWVIATAAPFGIALLVLQWQLYGHPLKTGYGGVGEMLAWSNFPLAFPSYAKWLVLLATPLGFFTKRTLILAWFLPYLAFYSFYSEHGSWGVLRFLLPAIPALIFGALLWIVRVKLAMGLAAILVLVPAWQSRRLHVFATKDAEQIYRNTVQWAEPQLPPDSLVIAGLLSGAFLYHAHRFTVNWPAVDAERFQRMRAYAGVAGLRWYAVLSDAEMKRDAFASRYPGPWVEVSRYRDITLYRRAD